MQQWSSKGFFQQKQALPRGKGLGGSGLMNFMMHEVDFESLDQLRNYMRINDLKKIVKHTNSENQVSSYYLSLLFDEHINTESEKSFYQTNFLQLSNSTLSRLLQKSVVELNNSHVEFKPSYSAIYNGERWASYHSHLIPASKRTNLHVLCNHEVVQIIFNNKKAIGVVALSSDGNYKTIYSDKEIILSAGAINSPKLLLLSGIGNNASLQALKIPVVANVPGVGLNLHDHFQVPLYISIKEPVSVTVPKLLCLREIYNYLFYKKGLLSESPIAGTINLNPDAYLILFGIGSTDENIFQNVGNYLSSTFRNVFPFHKNLSREGFVFLAGCRKPKSRGYVALNNSEPHSPPLINPRYLQNRSDFKCISNAIRLVEKITKMPEFHKIGAKIHWPQFKQCLRHTKHRTKMNYFKCITRISAITSYHQAGTCKMGEQSDALAVVDKNFRVRSVDGLRIVDASILPTPTYSFPNTMIITLAELAALLIKLA